MKLWQPYVCGNKNPPDAPGHSNIFHLSLSFSAEPPVHCLTYLHYLFLSVLSCLCFPHYSTLNPGSIFPIRLLPVFSTPSSPCPFVVFMGRNNSTFSMFTPGCQEDPEKDYITWQTTSIRAHLLQLSSALPGNLPRFLRVVCFPHFCQHHFKSSFLSSDFLAFSCPYWLLSEKIETVWWKQPQLPANKSSNQTAFVPTVPTS